MFAEAAEAATCVEAQHTSAAVLERIGKVLQQRAPHTVITCARGSSDHAATLAKYLIETRTGIPTASAALSVSSLYASAVRAQGTLCLAISQSGRSPDLLASVSALKQSGSFVLAMVNDADAPLAELADEVLPLSAGAETSVAATKSYIASLAMIVRLVAEWSGDRSLHDDLLRLPGLLRQSWSLDWSPLVETLGDCTNMYVVGRGIGLGIAQEAALKLKETCRIHAEAFSSAELQHGPMVLVKDGFPVLLFSQVDETAEAMQETGALLAARGARVLFAGPAPAGTQCLPTISASPIIQPILQIQTFYAAVGALALERGLDPDRPAHLSKVTRTI
jgi:glucosamine--fructose-6-phosphate aminotransferase (isomerizing)